MEYNGSKIQILDLPGIIEGAKDGKGRGRQVISVARTSDLIVLMIDGTKPLELKEKIEYELEGFGIRLNKSKRPVTVTVKDRGGITLSSTVAQSELTKEIVTDVLKEYRVSNADVVCHCDATVQDLLDNLERGIKYIPCIYVINKIDEMAEEYVEELMERENTVCISADQEMNLDLLRDMIWERVQLIRVYPRPVGQQTDYDNPIVLPKHKATVENFCMKIHKQLVKDMRYALVWGTSVKHDPQRVGKDHRLNDEDTVQIVKK